MTDWIFLRGLIREQRQWGRFVNEFETCIVDSTVHTIDLPGNGELNFMRSPVNMREMVEACRCQLLEQGLAPPYKLFAVSMGAMVAVQWATSFPDEVLSMVLINTSMRPFSPVYQRLRWRSCISILKLAIKGANAEQWERAILQMTTHHPREDVLRNWQALRERFPVTGANAMRQLFAAAMFKASPRKPTSQILLLASDRDQLVSGECSKTIARSWNVPLKLHLTAGHDLPLDDGLWVANQVRLWEQLGTAT